MSHSLLGRLQDQFGFDGPPDGLFHRADWTLRFDLGGDWAIDGDQVTRFLQALDRARAICEAAFENSEAVDAVIRTWGARRPAADHRTFRRLARMGFKPPLVFEGDYLAPDDDPAARTHFFLAGRTTAADRAVLIWDACATETGVEPASSFTAGRPDSFASLLVDFERGVLLNVYDDRGLDLVATRREALQPLHARFGDWLLDPGRDRMHQMFAS